MNTWTLYQDAVAAYRRQAQGVAGFVSADRNAAIQAVDRVMRVSAALEGAVHALAKDAKPATKGKSAAK